jgi:hypothetical protein
MIGHPTRLRSGLRAKMSLFERTSRTYTPIEEEESSDEKDGVGELDSGEYRAQRARRRELAGCVIPWVAFTLLLSLLSGSPFLQSRGGGGFGTFETGFETDFGAWFPCMERISRYSAYMYVHTVGRAGAGGN